MLPQKDNPVESKAKSKPKAGEPKSTSKVMANPDAAPKPTASASSKTGDQRSTARDDGWGAMLDPFYYGKSLTDPVNTIRDKWNLLPAFLKVKGLVKQHIDSFNYFVEVELQKIIAANRVVLSDHDPEFFIRYDNIYVGHPNRVDELQTQSSDITPNQCRLRDLTYAAPIFVDITYTRKGSSGRVFRKGVQIGRLPIMLKSSKCVLAQQGHAKLGAIDECPLDPGGYFIVNGTEKVILVQEQLSKNRIIVEADPKKEIVQASVTSSTHERKTKCYVTMKKGRIYLLHNSFQDEIPIVVIFKAMGITAALQIMHLVTGTDAAYQDTFAINFEETMNLNIETQQSALDYLGSKTRMGGKSGTYGSNRRNHAQEALEALAFVIIPHVPVRDLDFRSKAMYIAFMTRRVLMAYHNPKSVDDRDYVGNKRLELAGQMLSLLFEDLFKKFNHDLKLNADKVLKKPNTTNPMDAYDLFKQHSGSITGGMNRAISTGNWNVKRFKMNKAGVTHVLSRLSYISALGMMTRITSQFEKTRKVSGPRALQLSQFGMLCLSDTPEGEACGLVKNLALMTHITTDVEDQPIKTIIFSLGTQDLYSIPGDELYDEGYIVFLNGTPIAFTRVPKQFLNAFRQLRRRGRISEFVSIFINHDHKAVYVASDEGRICRPMIIVENSKSRVTTRHLKALRSGSAGFDDFLRSGLVEYLDVNEENDSNIAMYEADIDEITTHLEIEPFTILGAVAGLIPYPHHNQSPRNTYQCAMGKQAIGAIASNQFLRIDTLLYLMVYPQKPLVTTRAIELVKYDKLPAGQSATVAVMSYSGYDIEDALVLNKASCDRGFGRCQVYRKHATTLRKHSTTSNLQDRIADTFFVAPNEPEKSQTKLDTYGVVEVGLQLVQGDRMLLKQTPSPSITNSALNDNRQVEWISQPLTYRLADPAYVNQLMLSTSDQNDVPLIKIQTRQTRRPEVGDKFSSRHGQKGVVGIIAEQTDMPFSDTGIVPDIIMNPHGFPSRMTVGKILECVAGKAGVMTGEVKYGTAFGGSEMEDIASILIDKGFSYSGKDYLTSGITGEPLQAYVFSGPIFYQKLKHMVQDKMHSRSRGPRAALTRQPTEGRSRDGGLRLGEMERDCLISYGASQVLLERLMLSSDAHEVEICETCGMMGFQGWCQVCRKSQGMVKMTIPYAAKLLVQEMLSMNISARFVLGDMFPIDQ